MKFLIGAAVAAILIASPAMAQTDAAPAASSCGAVTAAPSDAPDGAAADRAALDAYTVRFNAWSTATNQVLACKRARAEEALARANALASEYNNEYAALVAAVTAWSAEVEEFNARAPGRRASSVRQ